MALAEFDYTALTRSDILNGDQRLAVAPFVKIFSCASRRVEQRCPWVRALTDQVGHQHAGGRAVADTPSIESGCDVQARTLFLRRGTDEWYPVGGVIVFIDPMPRRLLGFEIAPNPFFEVTEPFRHIAIVSGLERWPEHHKQRTV